MKLVHGSIEESLNAMEIRAILGGTFTLLQTVLLLYIVIRG